MELEQLIISILDDPSVSRVMREASFSSPAVKATIEQSLSNNNKTTPSTSVLMTRNTYGGNNPRLQRSGVNENDDAERVMDILGRGKKRNPVLVGDSEPGRVTREIFKRIESGGAAAAVVKSSEVVNFEEIGSVRIRELDGLLETRIKKNSGTGVVLNLGDLKWLVEQPSSAVAELRRLLEKYGGRLWFVGTATCETYLRCQVYHPSMENDWDLQAVSLAAKAPSSGLFPRWVVFLSFSFFFLVMLKKRYKIYVKIHCH